jgi:hypothetical protein
MLKKVYKCHCGKASEAKSGGNALISVRGIYAASTFTGKDIEAG